MLNIGIIGGAGKMGAWLASQFKERYHVLIYDINTNQMHKVAMQLNINYEKTLETLVKKSDMIIVAVTLDKVPNVISELLSFNLNNKIVFDIASFKNNVIPIYLKYPKTVIVCSVHPLFGPGAKTIKNASVAIIPVPNREDDANMIKQFFEEFGANTIMIDWKTHDNIMGIVLGVPYMIGLSLAKITKGKGKLVKRLSGTSFKFLSIYVNSMLSEDTSLISEIISNESSRKAIKKYVKIVREIFNLRDNELQSFISSLKSQLKIDYDSYKKIYNIIHYYDYS